MSSTTRLKNLGSIGGQDEETAATTDLWINGLLLASCSSREHIPAQTTQVHFFATMELPPYSTFPETEVRMDVLSTIKKDPLIFKSKARRQFTALVVQPLRICPSNNQFTQYCTHFLIMIDGLEECIDRASQMAVSIDLADSVPDFIPFIRILVAT
ncbi:hypothetical protein CPC08DRAFT_71061 [Agrocybe pediades]|nr:hypothetical protein CPC08DRAFT_71061 [Agrocybe pediades]